MKFTIIGSSLSGNKGAASMLESTIQTLGDKYPGAEFVLLSVYPEEDRRLNIYNNLTILSSSPIKLGLELLPLALLCRLVHPLRSNIINKSPQLKAIHDSEALLEQGGITFSDGREIYLLYNVISILPAMLLGTKVIKCAQALGPFNNPVNRLVSKSILPRVKLIIARGKKTYEHLVTLGLRNIELATEYSFSLSISKENEEEAKRIYAKSSNAIDSHNKINVGISPSTVVNKKCKKAGIDYILLMQWFINDLISKGYIVTLVPHSVRIGTNKLHNNDLPLCQEIHAGVRNKSSCIFLNDELSSQALRYIIGQTDLFVASRFHAMISSLSMGVPTLVLGWSHKYMEILELFTINKYGIDSSKLSKKVLSESFNELASQRKDIVSGLKKKLPEIRKLSQSHVDLIDKAIKG